MTVYNKQHGKLIHEPLILKDTQITEYHDYQKLQEQIYLFAKKMNLKIQKSFSQN